MPPALHRPAMARFILFIVLLVVLAAGVYALSTVDASKPLKTVEKSVPDDRLAQ